MELPIGNNFNPKIVEETTSSIKISWHSIPCAEIYTTELEQQGKAHQWCRVYWGSRTMAKISHLDENFCYKFRIVAIKLSEDKNEYLVLKISEIIKACTLPTLPSTKCLYRAIQKSKKFLVKNILQKRPSLIDLPSPNGLTPLANAIVFGENGVIDILLRAQANVNKGDDLRKQTPLHISFFYGHIPVSRMLINKEVNINAQDSIGMTPAHYAVDAEQIDVLKFALENNCNTEIQDKCGWTLLQRAVAMNCSLPVIKLLIEHGCNLNAVEKNSSSCLKLARIIGNKDVIDLIEKTLEENKLHK